MIKVVNTAACQLLLCSPMTSEILIYFQQRSCIFYFVIASTGLGKKTTETLSFLRLKALVLTRTEKNNCNDCSSGSVYFFTDLFFFSLLHWVKTEKTERSSHLRHIHSNKQKRNVKIILINKWKQSIACQGGSLFMVPYLQNNKDCISTSLTHCTDIPYIKYQI